MRVILMCSVLMLSNAAFASSDITDDKSCKKKHSIHIKQSENKEMEKITASMLDKVMNNINSDRQAYFSAGIGATLHNAIIFNEILVDDVKNNNPYQITGAWFNRTYGDSIVESMDKRKLNFKNGISGSLSLGMEFGKFIKVDLELNGKLRKPQHDDFTDSRYLGVNLDHQGWQMKSLAGKQAQGIVVDQSLLVSNTGWVPDDDDDGRLRFYDNSHDMNDVDRKADYPKDMKYSGAVIGGDDSSNYWAGPGATGTYRYLNATGWDPSTGKAFYIATDRPRVALANPYRIDLNSGKTDISLMTNLQGCVTCAMNSRYRLYLGGGLGIVYYKMHKASKLGFGYQFKGDMEMDVGRNTSAFVSIRYGGALSPKLTDVSLKGWNSTKSASSLKNPPATASYPPGRNTAPSTHAYVDPAHRVPEAWTGGTGTRNYSTSVNSKRTDLPTVMNEYKQHTGHTFILEGNEDHRAVANLKFKDTTMDIIIGFKMKMGGGA